MSNWLKEYNKLNQKQKQAVDTIEGPIAVIAGPGTGKTQLLALRVANILLQTDMEPKNILCITFTDSGAFNLRKRLNEIIGKDSQKVEIYTFHSFGLETINRYNQFFFNSFNFVPLDELDRISILEEILQNLKYNDPLNKYHPNFGWSYLEDIKKAISGLKQEGILPEDLQKILEFNENLYKQINPIVNKTFNQKITKIKLTDFNYFYDEISQILLQQQEIEQKIYINLHGQELLTRFYLNTLNSLKEILDIQEKFKTQPITAWKNKWLEKNHLGEIIFKDFTRLNNQKSLQNIYDLYQKELYNKGFLDFDDMLVNLVLEIEKNEYLRLNLQEQYQYIMIDEFQDTNGIQLRLIYNLLKQLNLEELPNILVVGDDDQAIYKFQKANTTNMVEFIKSFKNIKIISLDYNYRSNQEILDLATTIIQNNTTRLVDIFGVTKNLISNK